MSYIEFTGATVASAPNGGWTDTNNAKTVDTTVASTTTEGGNRLAHLYLRGFTSATAIPSGADITGIEVILKAKATGSTADFGKVYCALLWDGNKRLYTDFKNPSTPTGSLSDLTMGSSSDYWGGFRPIKWDWWMVKNNPNFGIRITHANGTTGTLDVDGVTIRVHYTDDLEFLRGQSSVFPRDYDTFLTAHGTQGYTNTTDDIDRVRSAPVNQLGDAIYNVESFLISCTYVGPTIPADDVAGTGPPPDDDGDPVGPPINNEGGTETGTFGNIFVIVITIVGTILSDGIFAFTGYGNPATTGIESGVSTSSKTTTLSPAGSSYTCDWVSAIGWIDKAGGAGREPIYVSPFGIFSGPAANEYEFTVRCSGKDIFTNGYYLGFDTSPTPPYFASFGVPAPVPAGDFTIKLVGFGKEGHVSGHGFQDGGASDV